MKPKTKGHSTARTPPSPSKCSSLVVGGPNSEMGKTKKSQLLSDFDGTKSKGHVTAKIPFPPLKT